MFQSPSFKLGTLFKAQALNLAMFFKVQALNLAMFQSPSFKLGTLPKAQALNLALTTFISLTSKPKPSQAFKNFKISNQLTILSNKELRNPDSPLLNGDT